jgi:ferric enterobactin receptor
MKLVVIVKYLFVKRGNKAVVCIALFTVLFCLTSNAQRYKLVFEHVALSEALLKTSEHLNIKVAFDAQKLAAVFVSKEVNGNTPEEFMDHLLMNSGFSFQYKHNRFLIIENTPSEIFKKECRITGTIADKETGEQLPFASVILPNQNFNVSASSNGSYSISNVVSNPIHLLVNFIGYYPLDTIIRWNNNSLECDFKLSRKLQMIDSVVVKEVKVEMVDYRNDVDFATTINASKLIDLPLLGETDIFKTLQLLPGISYIENSSELSIRGGSGDQNLVLFDGQTLYNLSHYFGVISSLNPNVIKDIQVYKGGYDSRYGERVSGIVDITGKSGNQMRPTIYGDLNLVSANLTTEIPLGKKITFVAAGRRSYSDIYATSFANGLFKNNTSTFRGDSVNIVSETKPSFHFYDYNAKLTYRLSNNENFSLSFYGGKDFFNNSTSGFTRSLNVTATDKETWNNYGLSAGWLKRWNGNLFSNLQLGTSGYSNESSNSTNIDQSKAPNDNNHKYLPNINNLFNTYAQNDLTDFSAALRNTFDLNNAHQLNFGILTRRNSIYYHKDADKVYVYDNTDQSSWISSVYIQDRMLVFNNLTLKPGVRLNYYNGNHSIYLEPRFAANWRLSDKFSMRLATGRYYQFISQVQSQQETGYNKNFWVLTDESKHPVLASNHYIFGTTIEFGKFLLDAETYYKYFSGLQEYIYISQYLEHSDFPNYFPPKEPNDPNKQQPSFYAIGTGKSYGIDFFLRYKISHFTSWVSYSLSKSLHQFARINNNAEIPAPTDQTHQLSWTNMFSAGKWNLGTTTLFSTGRPYIDYTVNDQNLPTTRYYKRLPNYFRSDFSVNYNFNIGKAHLKMGATIINIFNTHNYFDISTRKFDFENTSFAETTLIKSQELSLNLFLHFIL